METRSSQKIEQSVHTGSATSATLLVFLVHPFKKNRHYADILEKWLDRSLGSCSELEGRFTTKVYEFDPVKMLSVSPKDPEYGFKELTNGLRIEIMNMQRSHASSNIIFIAQSLGAWVVKDVCASEFDRVFFVPVGFIVIDAEITLATYVSYIKLLRRHFSTSRTPFPVNSKDLDLAKLLENTDKLFNKGQDLANVKNEVRRSQFLGTIKYLEFSLCTPPIINPALTNRRLSDFFGVGRYRRRLEKYVQTLLRERDIGRLLIDIAAKSENNRRQVSEQEKISLPAEDSIAFPVTVVDPMPGNSAQMTVSEAEDFPTHGNVSKPNLQIEIPQLPISKPDPNAIGQGHKTGGHQSGGHQSGQRLVGQASHLRSGQEASPMSEADSFKAVDKRTTLPISQTGIDNSFDKTMTLAKYFRRNGEFENAELLFTKSMELVKGDNRTTPEMQKIEIRNQIAAIRLYRGNYQEADNDLTEIAKEFKSAPKGADPKKGMEIGRELQRWIAISLILRGQYRGAAVKLRRLLESPQNKVQVYRDLALAYGYLGYHIAAQHKIEEAEKCWKEHKTPLRKDENRNQNPDANLSDVKKKNRTRGAPDEPKVLDAEIPDLHPRYYSIVFTRAKLDMLKGEYKTALENSTDAFQKMKQQFGLKHMKTLETASLRAQLLAFMADFTAAEADIDKIIPIMKKKLGIKHPLTLEAMACQVYIFRGQSRFAEAVDTARSLYEITRDALTEDHPQTLRARSQLAASHLLLGEYFSAEKEIDKVVELSEKHDNSGGRRSPDTLRYKSEKAHILSSQGRLCEAKTLALEVLSVQRDIYSQAKSEDSTDSQDPSLDLPHIQYTSADVALLSQTVKDIRRGRNTFILHPSLLSTLEVLASIEARDSGLDLAAATLEIVVETRENNLGLTHALTLEAKYKLASMYRENDSDGSGLEKASDLFRDVSRNRVVLFHAQHPEALSAERELMITDCMRGVWRNDGPALSELQKGARSTTNTSVADSIPAHEIPKDNLTSKLTGDQWTNVEAVSYGIFEQQGLQLGFRHPETLKSYIWLLAVKLLSQNHDSMEPVAIMRDILDKLRHPEVRKERLVEALLMEENVGLLLGDQGHEKEAMAIFDQIIDEFDDNGLEIDQSLLSIVKSIVQDVRKDREELERQTEEKD